MQENQNEVSGPPHVSGSDHRDTSSAFLHSSKLRNKLEKLTKWRIDASLIEFPVNSVEFRGGFATVSQGLLASRTSTGGGVNGYPELTTDEQPSRDTENPRSESNLHSLGDDKQGKDVGVGGRTADGDNDRTNREGRKDNDNEHKQDNEASISKIGRDLTSLRHKTNAEPDSSDRDANLQLDISSRENDQQGRNEETDDWTVGGGYCETTERAKDREGTKEGQDGDGRTSKPKVVAVKKLKIEEDKDIERVLGLALRESEFLTELSHPNIVRLEGFVEDLTNQKVWLVFPWEDHGNLRDFLASGDWEIPERISLINDVALGLEYLHHHEPPIYHGDLKSLNILVNSDCHALITDFGSARHLQHDHAGTRAKNQEGLDKPRPATSDSTTIDENITLEAFFSATASTLTLTGSSYTLRWAAPELLQDDKPCLRSDIWSLGWIAYEVMTNTIPFHDIKKDAIVINHVVQGKLPSITEHARMSLIRALCSLMVRCWSINPDKRPTAEECRKLISWMPMIVPASTQAVPEEAAQLRHARLLNKLGNMYREQADYPNALRSFTAALDIYTNRNDHRGRGRTLRFLADVHRFRDEHNEAVRLYSEAQQILSEVGDENERSSALFGLAGTHLLRGEYAEAGKLYSECLQIYTNTGTKRQRASALWGLAEVRRHQAEDGEAMDLYSEALQIYTEVGDLRERALTLCGLAALLRRPEEYNEAINLYSEALQTYTDVGDHTERVTTLFNLAVLYWHQSRYSEASQLYSESLHISTDIGDKQGRGSALWGLAQVRRAVQEYDEATQLYSEALRIFTDIGDKHWRADVLMSYAETSKLQGHLSEAESLYTEASEVLEEIGDSSRASDALERASDIRKTLEGANADSTGTVKVGEEPC